MLDPSGAWRRRWARLWWTALVLCLAGLLLAPLRLGAFLALLAGAGALFGALHAFGRRTRRPPHLRRLAALTAAAAVAATATSFIWATPAPAAPAAPGPRGAVTLTRTP
jgi:hypothetical protein